MDTKALKDKILQLAVRGKLVPQDENDEPASVLLEKIKAEKEQLIKDKKIKKEKPLPEITEDEIPYELPKGWEWVRLGKATNIIMGQSPSSNTYNERKEGLPFYQGKAEFGELYPSPIKWCSQPKKIAIKNDVLISVRAPIGPTNICKEESCIGRGLAIIRSLCKTNYFYILYTIRAYEKLLAEKGTGSTFTAISSKDLNEFIIPLPPINEQNRIVDKINSLFELIDELNTNKQDLLQNISDARNKVLQLAVQGKLVPQDENDEPASVLLKKIKAEKEQLIKEKKIKKEKPQPEIAENEIPYELPKGWEWVRFSNVLDVRDGTHDTPKYIKQGIPLITSKNINGKYIDFSNVKYISKEDHEKISLRSRVDYGDILFAMIGSIGNPVIVEKNNEFSIKNVALFKYYRDDIVFNKYLYYYLLLNQIYMREKASGAVQSFVSLNFLRKYEFPLPPLNEQKRIVEKLDYFMEIFDKLEEQLTK